MFYKLHLKTYFNVSKYTQFEDLYGYYDVEQCIGCFGVSSLGKKRFKLK